MILRRLSTSIRKQDWFTVVVEILIVVIGVFLGLQVNNWNANRADEAAYRDAMQRLAEENGETLQYSKDTTDWIESRLASVQSAISVLESCDTGEEAEVAVDLGLNTIRAASTGAGALSALNLLVSDTRLLARQNSEERASLRQYAQEIAAYSFTSQKLLSFVDIHETDRHHFVGFTAILDPAESLNGVDVRRARITRPLDEVCQDQTFLKRFYEWERIHVYQLTLEKSLRESVMENSRAFGLSVDGPEPEPSR